MRRILIFLCLMVTLDFCTGFTMRNNSFYDVTIGEEKVLIFNLSQNQNDYHDYYGLFYYNDSFIISKNGSSVANLYQYISFKTAGKAMLYFPKITEENLGVYTVTLRLGKKNLYYGFTLVEAESETNSITLLIYISPAVSLAVCLIVIIVAVCVAKKKIQNGKEKHSNIETAKKNSTTPGSDFTVVATVSRQVRFPLHLCFAVSFGKAIHGRFLYLAAVYDYANSNNGAPASSPAPHEATSQRFQLKSTSSQAPLHPAGNSDTLPPPVSERTSSLQPAARASREMILAGQNNVFDQLRRSMESLDSFDDDADYEDTIPSNFKPPHFYHAPPPSTAFTNPRTQYGSNVAVRNQRTAFKYPSYVNQPAAVQMNDDDDEALYEGI